MADHTPGYSAEEALAAGRRRGAARVPLAAGMAAVLVLVLFANRARTGTPAHASRPAGSVAGSRLPLAATDPLLPGASTGYRLARRIVYTTELTNATASALRVDHPIRLRGARIVRATLRYVELTASGGLISFGMPPHGIVRIPAHGTALLQIGLRVRCASPSRRRPWSGADSRIVIGLVGHPAPTVFRFGELFAVHPRADFRAACSAGYSFSKGA